MHTVNSRVLSALMPGTGALGASASAQLAGNVRNELRRADAAAAAAPAHGKDRKVCALRPGCFGKGVPSPCIGMQNTT